MRKAACIASTAVLLAALAFLGLKVKEFNGTEHEQFQTALWQLKHLGTAFNEDVLEARFALLDNYDDFQQYKEQAEDAVKALNRPPAFVTSTGRKAIAEARVEYTELLRDRETLFERFKSQNAVLANSRRYLPVALEELAVRLGRDSAGRELESAVNDLARLTLLRLSSPEELPTETQERLRRLKDWSAQHPGHAEARFVSSLVRHAETIVTGNGKLDVLTRELLALPTEAGIQKLFQAYESDVAKALRRSQQYRALLYLLGSVLLAGLGYSLWALRAANRHLEHRVRERTGELARSEERFRTLCVASPMGIYMADVEGRCVYANPAWERISGLTANETCDGQWVDILHPDDRENVVAEWAAATKNGQSFAREFRLLPGGQELRWVSSHAAPLRTADGELAGFVGTVENISERKAAEAALEAAHNQLLETSRQAGMAEVATSVLHNVGNVLNSVNVSSTCVADNLRKSRAASLTKVVALLREHENDLGTFFASDPRGKQVPDYLALLADHLAAEQAAALNELAQLQKNIEHIKDIVAMQQTCAKVSGVTETVQARELVEDALRMDASALARHDVGVIREFEEVPPITVEKHRVLQILVNLVRNAKYACDESGRPDKRLTVRVANGDGRVAISVIDNGAGIPAANLTRIFNHGFTTRKDGHGFALHSGALAAKEMGGRLSAHSEGAGRGAMFILELPIPTS